MLGSWGGRTIGKGKSLVRCARDAAPTSHPRGRVAGRSPADGGGITTCGNNFDRDLDEVEAGVSAAMVRTSSTHGVAGRADAELTHQPYGGWVSRILYDATGACRLHSGLSDMGLRG